MVAKFFTGSPGATTQFAPALSQRRRISCSAGQLPSAECSRWSSLRAAVFAVPAQRWG